MSVESLQAGPLLMPGEVAALFGVDRKTVTRWANAGKLKFVRTPGGHRRFFELEVLDLISHSSSQRTHTKTRGR